MRKQHSIYCHVLYQITHYLLSVAKYFTSRHIVFTAHAPSIGLYLQNINAQIIKGQALNTDQE